MAEGQTIDREQFLKDNKLGNVIKIFVDRDITIEELLEFGRDDLKEFAKDIGLDALSKNRLVKAVMKLKQPQGGIGVNPSAPIATSGFSSAPLQTGFISASNATHVIVSPEEHEAISKLYERYEDSSKLIVSLKNSFDLLKDSAAKCKIDVNEGFERLVASLENKKTELIDEAKTVKETKKEKLLNQLQGLKEYCLLISNGKTKYEEYISDATMDIHKRKSAILSMIDGILSDKKVPLVMVTQPKMAFNVDDKQVKKFLESLVIDDCDQPFPPIVEITKIDHDRVLIEWHLDAKYQTNNTKKVLSFEVSWCKLPKSYLKIDEKEKKKSKKSSKKSSKKKNKKRKKNKKKKYSSSEDSQTESGADSEAEEEVSKEIESIKPSEGDKNVTGSTLKKLSVMKASSEKKVKSKKKGKKKKKKGSDSESNSDSDSSSSSSSGSSSSSTDSESDSDSSSSSSDSDSDSTTDSEEEEKSSSRKKKKKKKGKKSEKIEFEVMDELKELEDMKWDTQEIQIRKDKEISVSKRFKFAIEDLRDNTAYCVKVRGFNASGWGNYTKPIKVQTPKMTLASKILKSKEMGYLTKVLPKKMRNKRFKLLFRAAKDGFAAATFHTKCDNKGATITIVHSVMGHVFGGYTSMAWSNTGSYRHDQNAFLFLLRSSRKKSDLPQKWTVTNATNAVQHNASYGPTFGGGHDFYLCNNCNSVNSSYSNLGNSYSAPKDQSLLAGSYNFMVKDYEVWQVK